jgi:hypothetical protein
MLLGSFSGRISSATRAQSFARFKMRRKMPSSALRVAGPAHGTCRTVSPDFNSLVWLARHARYSVIRLAVIALSGSCLK